MANTKISYLYRDAANYKQYASVIVEGEISEADLQTIMRKLIDGFLFIPEQVGLENLQKRFDHLDGDDHIYHELYPKDIYLVEEAPTVSISAKRLVRNFKNVRWNSMKATRKLGLL